MAVRKRTLFAGAAVAAIGMAMAGGIGLASAATPTADNTSIVDKIATKFNLDKDDVQAVFDEDRSEREAEMKQHQAERLQQAVTDGKLTQEQADYIANALEEIKDLRPDPKAAEKPDETTREQLKSKFEALKTWAEDNGIDLSDIGLMVQIKEGGPGGPGGDRMFMKHTIDGNESGTSSNEG